MQHVDIIWCTGQPCNAGCENYLRKRQVLDTLIPSKLQWLFDQQQRSVAMIDPIHLLVPIVLFGIGIIISAFLGGVGIERVIEAKNRG
jgi:hypothetical protein